MELWEARAQLEAVVSDPAREVGELDDQVKARGLRTVGVHRSSRCCQRVLAM
jgi:hypothetical protein